MNILYEDNHLIAVYKPAGMLTQPDTLGGRSLMIEVKKYLKEKYRKPGQVFLGLVQRLDRPVAGIVLFAKTSKAASRLAEQFRERRVEKIYHAVVIGCPAKETGNIKSRLKKEFSRRKTEVSDEGKEAELDYRVIKKGEKYSLLEIRPKTGRPHQIRSQLASIGLPILGDVKYGAPFPLDDRSIALAATGIVFETTVTKEKKKISIPFPPAWSRYF
jgi:23S rRNA pseudouridine1911/1915/1917 synthase